MRRLDFSLPVVAVLSIVLAFVPRAFAQDDDQAKQSPYPVEPIYPPELVRPAVKAAPEMLPEGTVGRLPERDGDPFRINLAAAPDVEASAEAATKVLDGILGAMSLTRDGAGLRVEEREAAQPPTDQEGLEQETREREERTRRELTGRFGEINEATEEMLREQADEALRLPQRRQQVFRYQQYHTDVPIDNAALVVIWRSDQGFAGVTGRVFGQVNVINSRELDAARARAAAEAHIGRSTTLSESAEPRPELVLIPYGEGFRYAWRMVVTATEGPYRVWIDAQDGAVLKLEPDFFADSGQGLVFDPDPPTGTEVKSFTVDAPSGGNYRLLDSGVLDANNSGADGVCTGDLTIADPGTGTADFNVAPINGTVVARTNQANYNCRFQDVNTFAWLSGHIETITGVLGGQPLASITATTNHNNPCGFGINNACASGCCTLIFGIGGATTGTSTACGQLFNSAIDATVVTHEFGHLVNRNQYGVSGGSMTDAINEGMADFWADTLHNVNTMGSFWANNCPVPVQSSFVPRQAEALDIFPEHRINFGDGFPHTDGQIIAWALWNGRQELQAASALGAFIYNTNFLTAQTTAGVGVATGTSFRRVHDSFLDLLQQMAPLYQTSRNIHKVLSGFARAGIFLAPRDAVIDIDDDFLDRGDATGPTFTVWTGRDYTFNVDGTVNTASQPFNTQFTVEVANDEAFTVNLVSSGVQGGVVAGAGGVGTWPLPVADWNTLKAQDELFYRVTTTDGAGGNARSSANPGNGTLTGVPPGRAVINESGECECNCAMAPASGRGTALITLLPLLIALAWRFRLRRAIA